MITFPNANNRQVNSKIFLAAWNVLYERAYAENFPRWSDSIVAIHNSKQSTPKIIESFGSEFVNSFDMLCRIVSGYHNTMQCTPQFRTENRHYIELRQDANSLNKNPRNPVIGVKPTKEAVAEWESISADEKTRLLAEAEALFESDQDNDGNIICCSQPVKIASATQNTIVNNIINLNASTPDYLIAAYINETPLQIFYRKNPQRTIDFGWDKKLCAYFWPNPNAGYKETANIFNNLVKGCQSFTKKVVDSEPWTESDSNTAVMWANKVFSWGGVPQKGFSGDDVRAVIEAALRQDSNSNAKMNSGWTKIAAIASEHFPPHVVRTVIWDSRVSEAIISILDKTFAPKTLPELGRVNGRGGTRPRTLTQKWPNGYKSWKAQVAGSMLVEKIRKTLNSGPYPQMPLPGGGVGVWTTRGVEMVLFMEGY